MGKLSKDRRDVFYQKAKVEGYRARSAYKLLQLNEKFNLFHKGVKSVVDLCAAPGSWSQVAREKLDELYEKEERNADSKIDRSNTKMIDEYRVNNSFEEVSDEAVIVAVDIQEMAPIEGVQILKGDITLSETLRNIQKLFYTTHADLIMSDGAPDITGLHDMDEYIQNQLLLASLNAATKLLRNGGTFVAKVFRGENISFVYLQLHSLFRSVICSKPSSSRNSSLEAFVVCTEFGNPLSMLTKELRMNTSASIEMQINKKDHSEDDTDNRPHDGLNPIIPFIACGDLSGFDSNRSYELDDAHIFIDPIQPPIDAPYRSRQSIHSYF